jgi:hypothetical protein
MRAGRGFSAGSFNCFICFFFVTNFHFANQGCLLPLQIAPAVDGCPDDLHVVRALVR